MKTRAAVAWEAGKPLEVLEIDLEGRARARSLLDLIANKRVSRRGVFRFRDAAVLLVLILFLMFHPNGIIAVNPEPMR